MPKGGDTRARAAANGKKVGRPEKPKAPSKATHSVATEVLGMNGAPDHVRRCGCRFCSSKPKCSCEDPEPGESKVVCDDCKKRAEHKVCHCEICRWWSHRLSTDKRIRYDADVYLTNQRDGKPTEKIEGSFDPDKPFVLTIEHIGRNSRPAAASAAQTK